MREIRLYGSEGGVPRKRGIPTPINEIRPGWNPDLQGSIAAFLRHGGSGSTRTEAVIRIADAGPFSMVFGKQVCFNDGEDGTGERR